MPWTYILLPQQYVAVKIIRILLQHHYFIWQQSVATSCQRVLTYPTHLAVHTYSRLAACSFSHCRQVPAWDEVDDTFAPNTSFHTTTILMFCPPILRLCQVTRHFDCSFISSRHAYRRTGKSALLCGALRGSSDRMASLIELTAPVLCNWTGSTWRKTWKKAIYLFLSAD